MPTVLLYLLDAAYHHLISSSSSSSSSIQAKVAGLKFSARTTLEVREWPQGLPDFAHFYDEIWQGRTRQERAREYDKVPLQRYAFPRPFAISKLPHRDITMQSVENDDGEFRLYQGVWRLQPLPGCIPEGRGLSAMRLTYAVEGRLWRDVKGLICGHGFLLSNSQ